MGEMPKKTGQFSILNDPRRSKVERLEGERFEDKRKMSLMSSILKFNEDHPKFLRALHDHCMGLLVILQGQIKKYLAR